MGRFPHAAHRTRLSFWVMNSLPSPEPRGSGAGGGRAVVTPFSGTAVSLRAVPDPVFAMGTMGYGVAVIPDPDVDMVRVTAPITGVITRVQPHLYVIQAVPPESTARRILSGWRRFAEASDHPSVVVSVGVDTARLGGVGYDLHVGEGQLVRRGEALCSFAPRELSQLGFDPITSVVGLQLTADEVELRVMEGEPVLAGDCLFLL